MCAAMNASVEGFELRNIAAHLASSIGTKLYSIFSKSIFLSGVERTLSDEYLIDIFVLQFPNYDDS